MLLWNGISKLRNRKRSALIVSSNICLERRCYTSFRSSWRQGSATRIRRHENWNERPGTKEHIIQIIFIRKFFSVSTDFWLFHRFYFLFRSSKLQTQIIGTQFCFCISEQVKKLFLIVGLNCEWSHSILNNSGNMKSEQ